MTDKNGKWVTMEMDLEECEVMSLACETLEQVARMNGMNSASEQATRVVMSRVRGKLNVAASLMGNPAKRTDFEIAQSLPPWLRRN